MPDLRLADLHSHYPMHLPLVDRGDVSPHRPLLRLFDQIKDRIERAAFEAARKYLNDVSTRSGPAVSLQRYREGRVAIACSVLYSPFDELSLAGFAQHPPERQAFQSVLEQLEQVEHDLEKNASLAMVARSRADLDRAAALGKVALVHCVEGGFQLGASKKELQKNVPLLRKRGVLYVTLAHLLYRKVATNAPAFPFLSDEAYQRLHPQPASGLTDLGLAAVHQLFHCRVLIDVTHMSEASLRDTFVQLDKCDPDNTIPIIASHMACRFGALEYNLSDEWLRKIHRRHGVMGVILCEHYAADGSVQTPRTFDESFAVVCKHIDHIREVTGTFDNIAIGSDHDGFIKPTLKGLEDPSKLGHLADALEQKYGTQVATQICSANVRRVINATWTT